MSREIVLREIVKTKMPQLKALVTDSKNQSRYASAMVQIGLNLQNVEPNSVIKTAFEIIQLGLNPNPLLGQAYVVPYKNKAQLQIGYKGWITLGYRNGWKFRAVAVYDCDEFSIKFNGLSDIIKFKPNYDERNEDDGIWVYKHLKGVIVYSMDKDKNSFSEFVPFRKLEKLRCKSPNQKEGQLQHIWLEWAEEMYKAKALKYVITRLPISDDMLEASIKDENKVEEIKVEDTITIEPEEKRIGPEERKIEPEVDKDRADLIMRLIGAGIKRSVAIEEVDKLDNFKEYLQEDKFNDFLEKLKGKKDGV